VQVFETKDARAHFVDVPTLTRLLRAGHHRLQLVFVASCHSRVVGEAFLKAGVNYVVCVRREERVMDKASITFSRAFYHALFAGMYIISFSSLHHCTR
jgi:hypothetical protein